MVAYWDRDQRNQHVNDAVAEWTARTPDQIRGLHMREVLGDTLYEENLPHISAALEGEPQLYGRTLVDVAGQRRHVQVQYVPDLRDGQVLGSLS